MATKDQLTMPTSNLSLTAVSTTTFSPSLVKVNPFASAAPNTATSIKTYTNEPTARMRRLRKRNSKMVGISDTSAHMRNICCTDPMVTPNWVIVGAWERRASIINMTKYPAPRSTRARHAESQNNPKTSTAGHRFAQNTLTVRNGRNSILEKENSRMV